MGMFSNLSSTDMAADTDVLGGGRILLPSDIYKQTVEYAYAKKSASGAMGIHLSLKNEDGTTHKEVVYVSSGDAKGNKNTYTKDGKNYPLPGFATINSLCLLTAGKNLSELDTSDKIIKVWNGESEEPTTVNMIDDLIGQEVLTGMFFQTEDKQVKGDDGVYRPDGTTRDVNEISKFFRASDKLTVAEITKGATTPAFHDEWLGKWKGEIRNTAKGAKSNTAANDGIGGGSGSAPKSLFGNNS